MNRLLRRTLFSGSAALAGAVLWGAQSASADDGTDQVQQAVVDNSTTQQASAAVGSGQLNVSAPVTVGGIDHDHEWRMSEATSGGGGAVTQSNDATNSATAGNSNATAQEVFQGQGSSSIALGGTSHGAGQDQTADVSNATEQSAAAAVGNGQANVSTPVSVGGGGGGDVTQSNDATNTATAGNANDTGQFVAQGQGASSVAVGGVAWGGDQAQEATVDNEASQDAAAGVHNGQANVSTPVAVGGGGGGDVTQSNAAANSATAGNLNETAQEVLQGQGASSVAMSGAAATTDAGSGAGGGGGQDQSADVSNSTDQSAYATVDNGQYNIYAPVAVFSPGAGSGSVTQSNAAFNAATAGNANATFQGVDQGQAGSGGGHASSGQGQDATLSNGTRQSAAADVDNHQANIYAPVWVHSPGAGSGDVLQSNAAFNDATAGNLDVTEQIVLQEQAGSGSGGGQHQSADVANSTHQSAHATVDNGQYNIYAPVAVFSPGAGSGSVTQSNAAANAATAGNANATFQGVDQGQAASGASGSGQHQLASLSTRTRQSATSNVANGQANIHAPVAVGSAGAGSGAVNQSNSATNTASAFNLDEVFQALFQAAGRQSLRV